MAVRNCITFKGNTISLFTDENLNLNLPEIIKEAWWIQETDLTPEI